MKLFCTLAVFAASVLAAEKKVALESLPPAVHAAVKEQTKNATLVGVSTEKEKGRTTYEVETKVNGKSRDVVLSQTGALMEVEEEVDLDSIPAPAKAAIRKRAAGGVIVKVEKLTAGAAVSYEAAIKTKAGKNIEVGVNADGTPHKED
jgi:uncharacterized membrane protein YkoI